MRSHLFAVTLLTLLANPAFSRDWTDISGRKHVEAEFVSLEDGFLTLRLPDGKLRGCRVERVSIEDQRYVHRLQQTRADRNRPTDPQAKLPHAEAPDRRTSGSNSPAKSDVQPSKSSTQPQVRAAAERAAVTGNHTTKTAARSANAVVFEKYVYASCRGTFHIYANPDRATLDPKDPTTLGSGTGLYWFHQAHYLALLTQFDVDPAWFYYIPTGGDPSITIWAFARKPNHWGCHLVWYYSKADGWRIFERACREQLK